MLTKPRSLLDLEGASIFVLAIFLYRAGHFSCRLFALLFLAPDLFMLGRLIDAKCGAAFYNLVHPYRGPVALLLISFGLLAPAAHCVRIDLAGALGHRPYARFRLEIPHFFQGYAPRTRLLCLCGEPGLQLSRATCTIDMRA
jgi:hypothetical protein